MANNYKQYKKAKKEKNAYTNGQAASAALTGIGVGTLALKKAGDNIAKNAMTPTAEEIKKAAEQGKKIVSTKTSEAIRKKAGKTGVALTALGTAGLTFTTIKKQRAKRKLKELSEDDNKKK